METLTSTESLRQIGWNNIQLALPGGWETIVSGDRNLLIEQNFQPLIDLRWETATRGRTLEEIFLSIQRVLGKRSSCPVERVAVPAELALLEEKTDCIAFSWSANEGPSCRDRHQAINGLLWHCPDCATILIAQLYHHPKVALAQLSPVFDSIHCHPPEGENTETTYWSIQDFRITLPTSCKMTAHSFQAGLTRLTFQEQDMQLHFCRLAPAKQRLQQGPMSRLLTNLLGEDTKYQELNQSDHHYECINSPPLTQQMLKRLKRQHPFRWGRIWHDEQANRLLSVLAESRSPIDLSRVHKFCDHYEILDCQ